MTQPPYTELVELVASMRTELDGIRAENATLKARVAGIGSAGARQFPSLVEPTSPGP